MDSNLNRDEKTFLPAAGRRLTRREWVQRLLAGAGADIATPALVEALLAAPLPAAARAEAPGDWKPAFFYDAQYQSLTALAERIVPGSTAAQVSPFLDTALSADTRDSQQKFVASLNALEGEALREFTQSFKDLSASRAGCGFNCCRHGPTFQPRSQGGHGRSHPARGASPGSRPARLL